MEASEAQAGSPPAGEPGAESLQFQRLIVLDRHPERHFARLANPGMPFAFVATLVHGPILEIPQALVKWDENSA